VGIVISCVTFMVDLIPSSKPKWTTSELSEKGTGLDVVSMRYVALIFKCQKYSTLLPNGSAC
jgi:hypothetical protein